jgi:hypothetical protein
MTNDRTPYQLTLRRLGAYLDVHGLTHVHVMEGPSGFHIHYHEPESHLAREELLCIDDLVSLEAAQVGHQGRRGVSRHWRSPLVPSRAPYEDVFRALGYELEQARANSILLVEVDGSFLLTYIHLDAARGFIFRKHHTVVDAAEQVTLLRAAVARRAPRTRARSVQWAS